MKISGKILSIVIAIISASQIMLATVKADSSINETESNNTVENAMTIPSDCLISGNLGDQIDNAVDNWDIYKVVITDNGLLTMTLSSMDSALKDIGTSVESGTGAGYQSMRGNGTTKIALGEGTYYINVNGWGAKGSYTLKLQFERQLLASDKEPNTNEDQSQNILPDSKVTGNIGYLSRKYLSAGEYDNRDIFRLELPAKGKLKLEFSKDPSIEDVRTSVSNGNGSGFGSFDNSGVMEYSLEKGIYYISVQRYSGYGGYTLENSFIPAVTATPAQKPSPTPAKAPSSTPSKALTPTPAKTSSPTPVKVLTPTPVKAPSPTPARTSALTPHPDTNEQEKDTESEDKLISLSIKYTSIVMEIGKTLQLKASAKYSGGSDEDVTDFVEWSVSNKKIATVNETGLLRALSPGKTSLLAKLEGKTIKVDITVKYAEKKPLKIIVQRASLYIRKGQQAINTITLVYNDNSRENITSKATLISPDKSIVLVGKNGYFKAMKAGFVKMQIIYKGYKASFNVYVK